MAKTPQRRKVEGPKGGGSPTGEPHPGASPAVTGVPRPVRSGQSVALGVVARSGQSLALGVVARSGSSVKLGIFAHSGSRSGLEGTAISAFPAGTGSPRAFDDEWGAFTIGEGVGRPAGIPFQLAPRLYVLSRGKLGHRTAAKSGQGRRPFDELPQHLIFRESPPNGGEPAHQRWISEEASDWTWELIVERNADGIQATLTARSSANDSKTGRLTWRKSGGWDAFGSNQLEPETSEHDVPPLIAAAP